MRWGLLLVLAMACDADYEIPRPPVFETSPAPPPSGPDAPQVPTIPRIEIHMPTPEDITKGLFDGSAAPPPTLPPKLDPCAVVTREDARKLLGGVVEPGESFASICSYARKGTDDVLTVTVDTYSSSLWDANKADIAHERNFAEVPIEGGAGWRLRRGDQLAVYRYRGASSPSVAITSTVPFRINDAGVIALMKVFATRL